MTQDSLFDPTPAPTPTRSQKPFLANIDGGARGNPGPAAYGVVVRNAEGKVVAELSEYLGIQTNNFAEYSGLLAALEYAVKEKIRALQVISDSELMVRQMRGQYKVSSPALKELFLRAQALVKNLESFKIEHVLRHNNKDADRLVNETLDNQRHSGMRR